MLLPREHGAWGIVAIPYLTAAAIAGSVRAAVLTGALAVLLVFLARYPLEILLIPAAHTRAGRPDRDKVQRYAWVYGVLAAGAGACLLVFWQLYLLVPLALAGLALFGLRVWWGRSREERSVAAEVTGTVGLTLTALVAWICATGGLNSTGWLVWGLNALFFSSGIVYVKARIGARLARQRGETASGATFAVVFHALVLLSVLGMVSARWFSPWVAVPYGLAVARAVWGLSASEKAFALRRLGWSEVGLSAVFGAFLILGFRL